MNWGPALPPFTLEVVESRGSPPTLSGTPATSIAVGEFYAFAPTASDPDGDTLEFFVTGEPSWSTFDGTMGSLSGTPQLTDLGEFLDIEISAWDGINGAILPAFAITVLPPPNMPPEISGTPPIPVIVGEAYGFTPAASDADGDGLVFSIVNRPSWAIFDTATGSLSGQPAATDVGIDADIEISVSDGEDSAAITPFTITVEAPPNNPPTISGAPLATLVVGETYGFTPTASDPDGNDLVFSIVNKPSWATFDPAAGSLELWSNVVF